MNDVCFNALGDVACVLPGVRRERRDHQLRVRELRIGDGLELMAPHQQTTSDQQNDDQRCTNT
ncbi:MAG TPA: hypothetical protein VG228_06255 [Solirubrobacteraceae bacterium]|jgi:hypothetical protein|nr:hypothetical protein [Solirubrobacteraceae bacterium]